MDSDEDLDGDFGGMPSGIDQIPQYEETALVCDYNPVFPYDDTGRNENWQQSDLPPTYQAFWHHYAHCPIVEVVSNEQVSGTCAKTAPSTDDMRSALADRSFMPREAQLLQLCEFLLAHIVRESAFIQADTVLLLTDTEPLAKYAHWTHTGRLLQQRLLMSKGEKWTVVVIPINEQTGLQDVHYTWGATFVLEAIMNIAPLASIMWYGIMTLLLPCFMRFGTSSNLSLKHDRLDGKTRNLCPAMTCRL